MSSIGQWPDTQPQSVLDRLTNNEEVVEQLAWPSDEMWQSRCFQPVDPFARPGFAGE
jgi:hypothetical protein